MIDAGTVGAYLTLDISGFRDSLNAAGNMLESFRKQRDDGFNASGLLSPLLGGLTAGMPAAGQAASDLARVFGGAFGRIRDDAQSAGVVIGGIGGVIHGITDSAAASQTERIGAALGETEKNIRGIADAAAALHPESIGAALGGAEQSIRGIAGSAAALQTDGLHAAEGLGRMTDASHALAKAAGEARDGADALHSAVEGGFDAAKITEEARLIGQKVAEVTAAASAQRRALAEDGLQMLDGYRGRLGEMIAASGGAWMALAAQQSSYGGRISENARRMTATVFSAVRELPEGTRSAAQLAWQGMRNELAAAAPLLYAAARRDGDSILSAVNGALGGMSAEGKRAVASLIGGMESGRGAAASCARGIMQGMLHSAGSVSFTGIGGNVVSGIIRGINDKAPSLMKRAASLAAGIAQTVRGALNVNSPSKVMIPLGQAVAEGMEVGLQKGAGSLYDTASAISLETAEVLGGMSAPEMRFADSRSLRGDRLDRLDKILDAVERLADTQTTMEIDGRPFGRLVRSAQRS